MLSENHVSTLIQRHFSTSIQLSNPTKIQRLFNVDCQLKFNVVSTLMCVLGCKPLCLLFNKSLRLKKYPRSWKIAHMIPLFKNGDKAFPSNYRPISLLSCVSKIFEKKLYFKTFLTIYIKINFNTNSNQVLSLAFRLLTNYLRYITLF